MFPTLTPIMIAALALVAILLFIGVCLLVPSQTGREIKRVDKNLATREQLAAQRCRDEATQVRKQGTAAYADTLKRRAGRV